jgi:hypothetical protein
MTASVPDSRAARNKRGSLAFGRNLAVLGTAILLLGLWGAIHGALTLRWPRAEATIVDAELRVTTTNSRTGPRELPEQWNTFIVHSCYEVAGQEYCGGGVEPWDFGMQNSAGAEKMRMRHPQGSKAQVAYDPENPRVSYIEPGPSSFSLILVFIGLEIGGAGMWVRSLAHRGIGRMEE